MAKKQKERLSAGSIWGVTRIGLGLVFFWAFIDKLFGLGFSTCRNGDTNAINVMCDSAWLAGGSPTTGYLQFGTSGPFADFYQSMAGYALVDWLFMIGLLGIGVALILGIGMRIAVTSGAIMMLMMYSAAFPSANNPIVDDHIIYALVLFGILKQDTDQRYGFGKQWRKTKLVKQYPILR